MRGLFILLFVAFCLYIFINLEPSQLEGFFENDSIKSEEIADQEKENQPVLQSKVEHNDKINGMASLIGQSEQEILELFGEPNRKDLSAYDYEWWVYNDKIEDYHQFGIKDGIVVTAFSTGRHSSNGPFEIGQSYHSLKEEYSFADTVTILHEEGSYRFHIKEDEIRARPLVMVEEGVYAQLYFDDFEQTLSSVRYLDDETLLKQRPYELVYRGPLIEPKDLNEKQMARVEEGNEQQIIDFTNIIRNRFDLAPVEWDEETAEVAFSHSKEMRESNYFSHNSPTTGSLKDRLMANNISFRIAGENIAAKYVDGLAAVEGWLNSEGHRNTLLNEKFTHLGVGVNEKYYTQNFIESW